MSFGMLRKSVMTASALVIGSSLVASPLTAYSQDGLDEIVVTARKREENLQDVPVAISVFTGAALKAAGIQTTRDLFNATPGLNYDTGFDQNAGTPAIRGVVSQEIATYRQKVTTFLDGMPILGQQGSVPFLAIQQVEVLRGPQSAAFGRSTFGGAINYTTRDPGEEFEAQVSLDVGSDNLFNLGGIVSGPLIDDKLGFLVAVARNSRDGESNWVTTAENVGLGGEEQSSALAKLKWMPTDNLDVEFTYKWLDVDNEQTPRTFMPLNSPNRMVHPDSVAAECGGFLVNGPPPQPSCAFVGTVSPFNQTYDYNYAAIGIDESFVRNQRDRFEIDATMELDNGWSLQGLGFTSDETYERATDANLNDDANGFERDPTEITETYAELRLNSGGDQRFRWGVGLSYYDYDFETLVFMSRAGFDLGPQGAGPRFSESATNTGVFFNLTADVTENTTVSLEGRYQSDDVAGNVLQDDNSTVELGSTTDAFLPRLSVTYSPSDNTTFYAQAAKGNNPAGVNTGAVDPDVQAAQAAFPNAFPASIDNIAFYEEEEVLSFEVGAKGSIGDRVNYAVNVYMLDWENYTQPFNLNFEPNDFVDVDDDGLGDVGSIYEGLDFGPGRSFLGAGDVTGSGLEVEGTIRVTDDFFIGLAASYIDITYDSGACSTLPLDYGVPANATTSIGLPCVSVAGKELGTQPKVSGAINFQYNRELGNGMEWFGRWNTRFLSSQYVSELNLAEVDGYSITDIRAGISKDAWRAEVYVTNLFDEDAVQGPQIFFDGRLAGPPPFVQNIAYTTRRGTVFGGRFSYNFGASR